MLENFEFRPFRDIRIRGSGSLGFWLKIKTTCTILCWSILNSSLLSIFCAFIYYRPYFCCYCQMHNFNYYWQFQFIQCLSCEWNWDDNNGVNYKCRYILYLFNQISSSFFLFHFIPSPALHLSWFLFHPFKDSSLLNLYLIFTFNL